MENELVLLGRKVSELRNKRGFTQEKLAELAGYSTNHIAKFELARTKPSYDLLLKISLALDVEIKDLFDFEETKTPQYYRKKLNSLINLTEDKKIPILYKFCKLFLDK